MAKFFNYEKGGCMNTQAVVADYRMSEWVQIIKERQNSGQTIRAFCEERGITEGFYFYWQRKLRKALCRGLTTLKEAENNTSGNWIQLSPAKEVKDTLAVEIAGCHVMVDTETDPELLKMVCRTLRGL